MVQVEDLKASYINWLKEKITIKNLNDIIEISTPFMDRHNDHLQIYVVPNKDGSSFKLTDDSYIMSDLEMSGLDIKSSSRRTEIFKTLLNSYGVSLSGNDELYINATSDTFPQKKHMLLQAMIAVNDMYMMSRSNIYSLFIEDVSSFLTHHEIYPSENIFLMGKSGFNHKFDFLIQRTKNKPERLIQTINNPTKERIQSLLFQWTDTRDTRKNKADLYAFLNDDGKRISPEILSALDQYEVTSVLWSNRDQYISDLM